MRTLRTVGILTLGTALAAAVWPRPLPAADDPVAARLDALERLVVRDPNRPDKAIAERLAVVEKAVAFRGPGELKTPEDVRDAVTDLAKRQKAGEDRLRTLERDRPAGGAERSTDDLRRELNDLRRELNDLKQRVQRVKN